MQCEHCGSTYKVYREGKSGMYLCPKHFKRMATIGSLRKTMFDPNDYIFYDDYAEIILNDRKGNEVARSKISLDKVELAKQYKWHIGTHDYLICKHNGKTLRLHRLISEAQDGDIVDHINRDSLDNRNENLRLVSVRENSFNRSPNKSSGVRGVTWHKVMGKWLVRIGFERQSIRIGYYDDYDEAVAVRREAEKKYYGEYAPDA